MRVFIDSNIPMYVAGRAHAHRTPSKVFLERVQDGTVEGCTSIGVLEEILSRYTAIGRRELARDVYDLFVETCPVVFDVTLADTDRARDLVNTSDRCSARDAVHAAVILNRDIEWIATFDRGFEAVPGVRRFDLTS